MDNAVRPVGRRPGRRAAAVLLAVAGAVLLAGCAGQPAAPAAPAAPPPGTTAAPATPTMDLAVATVTPTGTASPAGNAATASLQVSPPPSGAGVPAVPPSAGSIWAERAPLLEPNSELAVAELDGKVYALGGYPSTRVYVATVQVYVAGGRPPRGRDFAVYDPAADAWATLPDLPTQRNHLAAAAIDGKVYVAGGRFGGGVGSEMTDIVEVYDPAAGAWSRAAPMPTRRAGVNGIAARGCLYVFGGEGNDAHPRGLFPQVEVYDPRADAWRELEPIPTPVHGVTGAAYLDGWIHLPGGGVARGGNSGTTIHQAFRAVVTCEAGAP